MFKLGKLGPYVLRAALAIPQAVIAAEQASEVLHTPGADKRAAVVNVGRAELAAADTIAGKEIASDADVVAAIGAISDSIVALHNIVAKKAAAPPAA